VFSLCADSNGLEHEALDLKHVEGVILFHSHSVFTDVLKELLHEWVVGVRH